jgi:hypothetical protein
MPSASLLKWQQTRLTNLGLIESQCASCLAAVPSNGALIEENLRAYVLLLSAHFQGFARDLHTECAQIIASKVRISLQPLVQAQFSTRRELDSGNAHFGNLIKDFNRFGFSLKPILDAFPDSATLKKGLHDLNEWRNAAAHQNTTLPVGGPLTLVMIQGWRISCDSLAVALDTILYTHLVSILGKAPWVP